MYIVLIIDSSSLNQTDRDMGLLPDTQNYGLRMRRECRERFPRRRGLEIPTCITHVRDARAVMHVGIAD